MKAIKQIKTLIWPVIVMFALVGCSGNGLKRAEKHIAQNDWLRAVMEYRAELERDPGNIAVRSSLKQTELRAAEYYYKTGMIQISKNSYELAVSSFEQGLAAMPNNEKLQLAVRSTMAVRERSHLLKEAERYKKIGDLDKEKQALQRAIEISPGDVEVLRHWRDFAERVQRSIKDEFNLKSDETITLNFQDAPIKTAFNFLSDTFGINVIFDEEVADKKITLFANDITFRQALNLMMSTTLTFYKKVADNTILLAPDTKDKRGQYEDYIIRTYPLNNALAKEMADILNGVLSLQKVVVNEQLNTLTVRATDNNLELVSSLIRANDRKPAEIILEVEILEVDRQKSKQLGFDYGSVISLEYPEYNISGALTDTLAQGTLTLPSISFRYFKQNVDAETLANPKVRVIDGKKAKIHIGDRVPLRSSTIQDATGQTRTTFQYTDIGIRLQVEPQVQLDNSTLVNLSLEVSSLGQNLGTQAEPAFSIGTRNAETQMLLRDGETAILGGLIRDEDRRVRVKVPGLGDIPGLGLLFSSMEDATVRTDVLLTITPRIIRPWSLPPQDTRMLYSGTAERYFTVPQTERPALLLPDEITLASAQVDTGLSPVVALKLNNSNYRVNNGELLNVDLIRSLTEQSGTYPIRLRYDARLMEFVSAESSLDSAIRNVEQVTDGVIHAEVTFDKSRKLTENEALGRFVFRGKDKGVAFMILGGAAVSGNSSAQTPLQSDSAYVVIE